MGKQPATEEGLNPAQAKAVAVQTGPALIVAGAGTGKTRVIVERINRLLSEGVAPQRLLALTFTEKAAAEMLDRVTELSGSYQLDLPIMTFNAYGESLLRRYAADIGLGRNFTLLGESAQIVFLRERLDELELDYFAPVSRPDGMLADLAGYFSRLKQRVITPETHRKHIDKLPVNDEAGRLDKAKYQELGRAYSNYLRLCREANVIDYDDQIYLLLELFERRPNILKEVQQNYDFIMVDEFQDTNTMQSVLVNKLAGKRQNLFVVGDDDQSIYGWRGATLKNILEFKDTYPGAKEITLTQNYRSTSQILDAAYRLIKHNNPHRLEERLGINKRLTTDHDGDPPRVLGFENLEQELGWIARDIKLRIAGGTSPAAIAVLARRNDTLKKLHSYLDLEEIDHVLIGQRYELYDEPVVRVLLEALKTVVNPADSNSLYHTLTGPLFSISPQQVSGLAIQAKRTHQSLAEAIAESQPEELAEARQALELIDKWRETSGTMTVGQLAYEILKASGYEQYLYERVRQDPAADVAVSRLSELFATMKQFEQIAVIPSALQYVESLPALQAAGDSGEDGTLDLSGQSVNLLTIHKSKGLEWPLVYIVDCTERSFPLQETSRGINLPDGLGGAQTEADEHMSEERRLMYVAMTRARDELILTYADRHSAASRRKPSRFLLEAFDPESISLVASADAPAPLTLGRFTATLNPEVALPANILSGTTVSLSVSQVDKYLNCPLDFYYCHVLNVPQESSPALEYGTLMHGLLQDINESLKKGRLIDYAVLEERLRQAWPRHGHLSAQQRERARQQGLKTLRALYDQAADSARIPLAIEEDFNFNLADANLSIRGRFDAVFPYEDGVEIVDYKTSVTVNTPEKAKQRAGSSQQLTLYALAWQSIHGELPKQVTLEFIDTGMRGSIRKTQRGIDGMLDRLATVADGIRGRQFDPGKEHLFCIHPPV